MDSGQEVVAEYDADGHVVGTVSRARMRTEGRWHAAASVLVRSVDGARVYVHRRTDTKDVFPGMFDCWAGGVVAAGEAPEHCAQRELAEELGVTGVGLQPLFTVRYDRPPIRFHYFLFETRWDGPIRWQPEEIVSGQWMDLANLRDRLADPDWPFVPDGRLAIEEWFCRNASADLG